MVKTSLPGIILLFLTVPVTPAFPAAKVSDPGVPPGLTAAQYDNAGNDLLNKGQYEAAKRYLDAAIRLQPDLWTAYYNRAMTFVMLKNDKAALQDLNTTIRLQPAFFEASWTRSLVFKKMGNYEADLKDLDLLAKLTVQVQQGGQYCLVLNQSAWLRATCPNASFRDGKRAVGDAKRACELTHWKQAKYIDTLAAACAEAGDFDGAVRYEQQAIDLNRSGKDESVRKKGNPIQDKIADETAKSQQQALPGYLKRLQLYQQHHPYREA